MLTLKIQSGGSAAGQSVDLVDPFLTAGRHPDNNLCIEDDNTSAYHAKLEMLDADRYTVTDLDSLNGTFVNNRRVRSAVVKHGDTLKIGRLQALVADQSKNESIAALAAVSETAAAPRMVHIAKLSPPDASPSPRSLTAPVLKIVQPDADGDTDPQQPVEHLQAAAAVLELQEARAALSEAERQRDGAVAELQRFTSESQQECQAVAAQLEAARQTLAEREAEFKNAAAADAGQHETMLAAVATAEQERDGAVAELQRFTAESQQESRQVLAELEAARQALADRETELEKMAADFAAARERIEEMSLVIETAQRSSDTGTGQFDTDSPELAAILSRLAKEERRTLEQAKLLIDRRRAVDAAEQSRDAATKLLQQTVAELEAVRQTLTERQCALSQAEARIAEFEGA